MSNRQRPHDAGDHEGARGTHTEGPGAELDGDGRATAVLLAVSHAVTGWDTFERTSERLLRDLSVALDLVAGALWIPAGDALVATTIWCTPEIDRTALESALRPLRLHRGTCLSGSAWELRKPIHRTIPAPDGDESHSRSLRAHLALPAWTGDEVLGVVELYAASNTQFGKRLMHVLGTAGHLLGTLFAHRRGELKQSPLTARELEILALAAQGLTGRRIAEKLEISPATVKTHFEHVFRKLDVSDRTSAVAQAIRGGLIG
jgi:DNA-binding CsgD family transcriptional regulator